jgi:hypothetical protein
MAQLKLAGQVVEIAQPPFGRLRKIISSFNRMRVAGESTETAMAEASVVIGLLIGKTSDEVDEMSITIAEMTDAISAIPEICGLVQKAVSSGEAQTAVTDGIPSTAI